MMNTQITGASGGKPGKGAPKVRNQRKQSAHQAEIVRMAAVEAASRAAERRDMIATAAYFRAQQRGFEPGHELEDWFAAEAEIAHPSDST